MNVMPKSARPTAALRGSLLVLSMVVAAACGDRAAKNQAAADSTLVKDLALANQQTSVPTFQDTAVAPAPAPASRAKEEPPAPVRVKSAPRRTPRPVPQPVQRAPEPERAPVPAPVIHVPAASPAPLPAAIGAGSGGTLTSGSKVCTSTNLPGDKLVATLNEAITGTNGAVIPAGSSVVLEVASVNADNAQITFRVRSVVVNDRTYNVSADVTPQAPLEKSKVASQDNGKTKVIGGAIAGAILGQMIGHNTKGTIIGAAAGAAAGAAVNKSGEKYEGCLPAGAPLRLTLTAPLVIS